MGTPALRLLGDNRRMAVKHRSPRSRTLSRRQLLIGAGGTVVAASVAALAADRSVREGPIVLPSVDPDQPLGPGIVAFQTLPHHGQISATGGRGRVSATVNAMSAASVVSFPSGTFEGFDFSDPANDPVYGLYFGRKVLGILGSGVDKTVFQVHPNSSTKRAPLTGTNQLNVLRAGSGRIKLADFSVVATPQGHVYNGLEFYRALPGSTLTDVRVKGMAGTSGAPPGETFALNIFKSDAPVLTRVELDGTDSSGVPVAASLLGNNYHTDLTAIDCYFHDAKFGSGSTSYECDGEFRYIRPRLHRNKVGVNFEQYSGGTITMVEPEFVGNKYDIVIDSTLASAKVEILDPILAPGQTLKVCIHKLYSFGLPEPRPNRQLMSDITLIVGGVVRSDLITFIDTDP
jgi:hypothetical protein